MKGCLYLSLALALVCCYSCQDGTTEDIYLLTLLPYPHPDPAIDPFWQLGDNVRPVMELAMDQINNSSSLLHNYTLHLVHATEGCQVTPLTTVSFVENVIDSSNYRITGIIGPGCSFSTIKLGGLTNRTELSIVHVHGGTNPGLSNFRYMVGTLGSLENFMKAFLYLFNETNWENVAILYDHSRLFYRNAYIHLSKNKSIRFARPVSSTFIPLAEIREKKLRVIYVLCNPALARQIVCLAYRNDMIYRNYQWVFMEKRMADFNKLVDITYEGTNYNCSNMDMWDALDKALLMSFKLRSTSDSVLVPNITYDDYLLKYKQYREIYNMRPLRFPGQKKSMYTHWAAHYYDAVWAWALVLDNLTKSNNSFVIGSEYGNTAQAEMIMEQFYQTQFNGMSGEISFDRSTGFVDRAISIAQVKNSSVIDVAEVSSRSVTNFSKIEHIPDTFPTLSLRSAAIFSMVTVILQLMIILTFHMLTVIFHKRPSLKASSPKLLHFSYIGCYIAAIGLLIWTLNAAAGLHKDYRRYFCQMLWAWSLPVGFILSFVPVAMRTWRVYRIFKHYLNPGPFISDPILIGGTLLALFVMLAIALSWTILDPFDLTVSTKTIRTEVLIINGCGCKYYLYWLGLIVTYIVCILLMVSVFAILTRHIPIKSFTTTSLRVLCYVMTLLCVLGFPLYYILSLDDFDPIYSFVTLHLFVNLMLAAFILCIFLPPLLPVLKEEFAKKSEKKSACQNILPPLHTQYVNYSKIEPSLTRLRL